MSSTVKIERKKRFIEAVNSLNIRFVGKEIGRATGYQAGTVSAYLNPDEPDLSESFVRKVCEKFGLSFEDIWNGKASKEVRSPKVFIGHGTDTSIEAKYIHQLEKEVTRLEKEKQYEIILQDLTEYMHANNALLKTVLYCLSKMRSIAEDRELEEVQQEHHTVLSEEMEKILSRYK